MQPLRTTTAAACARRAGPCPVQGPRRRPAAAARPPAAPRPGREPLRVPAAAAGRDPQPPAAAAECAAPVQHSPGEGAGPGGVNGPLAQGSNDKGPPLATARELLQQAAAPTPAELRRLNGAFGFRTMPAAHDHTTAGVAHWVRNLLLFVDELKGSWPPWPDLAPADLGTLEGAVARLAGSAPHPPIEWLPEFGCAIVALPAPDGCAALQDEVALYLLAPDGWAFKAHSSPGRVDHTASASRVTPVSCASVRREQLPALLSLMHLLVDKQHSAKRKGKAKARSRSHFQRTPAFIRAALLSAQGGLQLWLAGELAEHLPFLPPRGGFTDVGVHTGGLPREVAWPLVRHTLQALLELATAPTGPPPLQQQQQLGPSELFSLAELHFQLWMAQWMAQRVTAEMATPKLLSECVAMLEAAAGKAAARAAGGHGVAAVEAACASIRQRLEAAAGQRQLEAARHYELTPGAAARGEWRLPMGWVPPALLPASAGDGLAAARARAARNLGALPCSGGERSLRGSLQGLLDVCSAARAAGDAPALQHALRTVEALLFGLAAPGASQLASAGAALGEPEGELLARAVDQYRLALRDFEATPAGRAPAAASRSELRSRAVLVAWVAFCLNVEAARGAHPLVRECGVPLDWRELRHLRLSDKAATDAALAVGAYLHRHTVPGSELFHLGIQQPSLAFAERFAASDGALSALLLEHHSAAERRMDEHWWVVQSRQQEAAQIRSAMRQLESTLSELRRERDAASAHSSSSWQLSEVQRKITNVDGELHSKWVQLDRAERAPAAVVQPLPRCASRARQWLFSLHMPPTLRRLARSSCLSQQLLLPPPPWGEGLLVPGLVASLAGHYNAHQQGPYYTPPRLYEGSDGGPGNVMLRSRSRLPVNVPSYIDQYRSREDGVLWPDSLAPVHAWEGSACAADEGAVPAGAHFNPFAAVPNAATVDAFTEQLGDDLQPGASRLQWMMPQYGSLEATAADRGNAALAHAWDAETQGALRTWLGRREYVAAARLRAFPLRQAHVLAQLLAQRELPLESPAVQEIVRQAVYHLGELAPPPAGGGGGGSPAGTAAERLALMWRSDWRGPGGVLEALCRELAELADELGEKPRAQQSVLLLGELAAFLSEHAEAARAAARRFAAMAARYADGQLQQQVDAARGDEEALAALSAKQARWRSMALLCHRAGALAEADVAEVLRLLVLIKRGDIYQPDAAAAAALAALRVRVHDAAARRLPDVLAAAEAAPALLTRAAASVLEWLDQPGAPRLDWQRVSAGGRRAAAFEAVGSDGHLYSLNILDGTLLVDGAPPGRLPREVLQHRLYRRVFGDTNHEVVAAGGGELLTVRPINGRFYRFRLAPSAVAAAGSDGGGGGEALVVTEVDHSQASGSLELELLDPGEDGSCGLWGSKLPERLRRMHSHWVNRQHRVIVLRPHDFREHGSAFLIRYGRLDAPPAAQRPQPPGGAAQAGQPAGERSLQKHPPPAFYACWRVPDHLQGRHWLQLLNEGRFRWQLAARQLVLVDAADSPVLRVLSKFEEPRLIHTYMPGGCPPLSLEGGGDKDGDGRGAGGQGEQQPAVLRSFGPVAAGCCFHLPRFGAGGLEFALGADGAVACRDYRGYSLAPRQLLVEQWQLRRWRGEQEQQGQGGQEQQVLYTLPGFHQYLVLRAQKAALAERQADEGRSDVVVLVPSGSVAVRRGAGGGPCEPSVALEVDGHCAAKLKAFAFEVHGRFGHLVAPTIHSRLQLAALYAATSSLLPEPRAQQTGAEAAMALLRQSWTNDLLSDGELAQLRSAARLGGHLAPALHLLAHDVEASAAQLEHLHMSPGGEADAQRRLRQRLGGGSLDPEAATAYLELARRQLPGGFGPNPRQLLTEDEERWLLHAQRGLSEASHVAPAWQRHSLFTPVGPLPAMPLPAGFVAEAEQRLLGLVVLPEAPAGPAPPYPLAQPSAHGTPLEARMHEQLQRSWRVHHSLPSSPQLAPGAAAAVKELQVRAGGHRRAAEAFLLHHLASVPDSVGAPGTAFRLLRLACALPAPAAADLLRCAWQPQRVRDLNPFLSGEACEQLRQGVLTWLQLCVLEDRLARLVQLGDGEGDRTSLLVKELLVHRTWDPARHPKWLVFEAEGRLQIRPAQHTVALTLLGGIRSGLAARNGGEAGGEEAGGGEEGCPPGPIVQLNMGQGKTRVILPMVALELADGAQLVRVNMLSNLLHEGRDHLHQNLTASVLGLKVFVQPFHRGVATSPAELRAMCAALDHCQRVGGVLVVAPEHRNSLHLKRVETELELLAAQGAHSHADGQGAAAAAEGDAEGGAAAAAEGGAEGAGGPGPQALALARQPGEGAEQLRRSLPLLRRLLGGCRAVDLLDESDELLHHRRRTLVYAYGRSMPLPSLQQRVEVTQGLLAVFSRLADAGAPELAARGVVRRTDLAAARKPGSFCGLELLAGGALQAVQAPLQRRLAEALVDDPPMDDELGWMRRHPQRRLLLRVLCEPDADANALLRGHLEQLPEGKQHQLLAARGLLACGLLAHGLQMRHRVDHGVSNLPGAAKRLSVPFRGADTPSERSEFALSDMAVLLTHLAYYHTGLSRAQFEECVRRLLQLGDSAQAYHYGRWLAAATEPGGGGGGAEPSSASSFDRVEKVDTSNPQLLSAMHAFFSHNREAVNFWLANCVLPADTRTYPSRLAATAWHLAHGGARGATGGFSGTRDNAPLLPSSVQQLHEVPDAGIAATDGLMLDLLLRHATYRTLQLGPPPQEQPPGGGAGAGARGGGSAPQAVAWRVLLDEALRRDVDALVDCGAMLAGVDLRAAAQYVLERAPAGRFAGATFFDARLRAWVVLEARSGSASTKAESSVPVADTFVIFDDPRCRGADHKLRQRAVALLTLAPGMPKDKLVQAAGRMRQLGAHQKLLVVGTPDIREKIEAAAAAAAAAEGQGGGERSGGGGGSDEPDIRSVLEWVVANTAAAVLGGVVEHAAQGMHFAATQGAQGAPALELLPERLELGDLWGAGRRPEPAAAAVAALAARHARHMQGERAALSANEQERRLAAVLRVRRRGEELAAGHTVVVGQAADDECERELEQEEEEEQEREREVPAAAAALEADWEFARAFEGPRSVAQLVAAAPALQRMPLADAVRLLPDVGGLHGIAWSPLVSCTANFVRSVTGLSGGDGLCQHLRPVDALLAFASGELLLLSEREADALQRELFSAHGAGAGEPEMLDLRRQPMLLSLAYAQLACREEEPAGAAGAAAPPPGLLLASLPGSAGGGRRADPQRLAEALRRRVPVSALVQAALFSGATSYASGAQRDCLRQLVRGKREAVQGLVSLRERDSWLSRSDLDRASAD